MTDPRMPVYVVGSPCSNRRHGCIGRIRVETCKKRGADGVLRDVQALICSRCGQAHGPAEVAA